MVDPHRQSGIWVRFLPRLIICRSKTLNVLSTVLGMPQAGIEGPPTCMRVIVFPSPSYVPLASRNSEFDQSLILLRTLLGLSLMRIEDPFFGLFSWTFPPEVPSAFASEDPPHFAHPVTLYRLASSCSCHVRAPGGSSLVSSWFSPAKG